LSTNHGISRFDPESETFRNYSVSDGLGSMEFNQFAFAEAPNGAMYFGSINGLNVFFPEEIRDNPYKPPITLTSLTQLGSPLETGQTPESLDEIVLTWPQNSFEFEFTVLGFSNPAQNQYAYKLENFDKDWYELGSKRNGRYTNLPGGTYTLRLKAANSDGVWDEEGKSIRVTVIPPFWQTWWFRIGSALFIIASVAVGYRVRMRQVESHNRELEALVRKRTAEIEELFEQTKELAVMEERNRLARDLHDSAKQKAFAALAQLGTVNGMLRSNPVVWKHLNEAENLVYEVIQELTFLIQEMYPAALMEKGLPTTVREYLFEWENRNEIHVDLVMRDERLLGLKIEQAIYRVIQESLANVARHSRAGRVAVSLQYFPDSLEVSISDNGCGFDITKKMRGLGLRSIRERIESIGGEVRFESGNGQGTRVFVRVPLHEYELSGGVHA
jgi:signal transduction histidine kinase